MTGNAIEIRKLRKIYPGGVEAVKGIDLDIATGEVFGLLGPNGAGKSTTIGMLTTTVLPTSGEARVAGFDVAKRPLAARAVSSVVFQEPVVDRALSGRANLRIHARLWGVNASAAAAGIAEIAPAFGLSELLDRPVGSYSGGERRRLEIARAMLSQPSVLFLDEPTVGLDPRIRFELLDLIAGLRQANDVTVMLTTHYLDEAERLCDRVGIIHEGRVVALDRPSKLLSSFGHEIVEVRVRAEAAKVLEILRSHGVAGENAFAVGNTLTVPLQELSASQAVAAVEALGITTEAIATRTPTLDDVYLRLTGNRLEAA